MRIWLTAATAIVTLISFNATAMSASLSGKWKGQGHMKLAQGGTEAVSCRANFSPLTKTAYHVVTNCSIPAAGLVKQTGRVRKVRSNYYSGNFYNKQYDVHGTISIQLLNDRTQRVTLNSANGTGNMKLRKY